MLLFSVTNHRYVRSVCIWSSVCLCVWLYGWVCLHGSILLQLLHALTSSIHPFSNKSLFKLRFVQFLPVPPVPRPLHPLHPSHHALSTSVSQPIAVFQTWRERQTPENVPQILSLPFTCDEPGRTLSESDAFTPTGKYLETFCGIWFKNAGGRTWRSVSVYSLHVVQGCYFQLRNVAKLKLFVPFNDLQSVLNALISLWLDYCNILYLGISQSSLSLWQLELWSL